MTQNVVTFTVVVTTDNSSGKLLPYLTANVKFEIERKSNVLLVPNATLRWTPDTTQLDSSVDQTILDEEFPEGRGRIWVAGSNGRVKPINVTVGSTDGLESEINGNGLDVGLPIVVGEEESDDTSEEVGTDTEANNPFLPKPPKGNKGPPPGPM